MVRSYIFDSTFSEAGGDDGFFGTLTRVDDLAAGVLLENFLSANIALAPGLEAKLIRVDSEDPHYLEVSPATAWIVNGWTSNEVVSDLTWIVD